MSQSGATSLAGTNTSKWAISQDAITFGVAMAAILLFVGTGSSVVHKIIRSVQGIGLAPDSLLTTTLLLNLALIMFGWRRYRQLTSEVEQHKRSEAQALLLSERDPLTGFLNRRSLNDAAANLIADCASRGEAVAFLVADLDGFKQINDLNGHIAGDHMLQTCADRISELLPVRALAARLGGDEFACMVPFKIGSADQIDTFARTLIDAIAQPIKVDGLDIETTLSIGIARSNLQAEPDALLPDAQRLLAAADIAMYHAKRHGRNCYFWFEATMEVELRTKRELEAGIRRGIEMGEFVPYYEQQIDLKTGKLTGFEMLARWNSPSFGIVNPQVFIPIAEELGIIDQLSEQLIGKALQDAMAWDPQLTLSVNISPIQLRDPWFSQKLLKQLVTANFPPQRLELEITESCLHENVGAVRTLLASLKNQGIRISLDDFGTGYSSLSQLRELPFDCIKIDRSFVMNLAEGKDSASIIKAITNLGEGLGLPITAEGIESEEVLSELREYGDFKGQGYLYGRPEPADATIKRLADLNLLRTSDQDQAPPAAETQRKVANG